MICFKDWKAKLALGVCSCGLLANFLLGTPTLSHAEQPKEVKQEQQQKTELELLIEQATNQLEQKNPISALTLCDQALTKYPKSPELYFLMGYICDASGYDDDAQELYDAAFGLVDNRFQDKMYAEDIYKNGIRADCIYPGARVSKPYLTVIAKGNQLFLKAKGNEWSNDYFSTGIISTQLQKILEEDSQINFKQFDNFMKKYKEKIKGCSIHPEGYIFFGLGDYDLMIPISPETKDKIKRL